MPKQSYEDPRIQRSKDMLCKALVELMEHQTYESISVKQLVEKAQIARSTFYLYYTDKADFVEKTIDNVLTRYEESATIFDDLPYQLSILKRSEAFFNYIASNADFYRVMLGNNGVASFRNKMASVGYKYFYARYEHLALKNVPEDKLLDRKTEFSIIANYIVEGKTSVANNWLNSGLRLSSRYLAQQTSNIVYDLLVQRKIL